MPNAKPVRVPEHTFAPGAEKISVPVEYYYGMLAAVKDVDVVFWIDPDSRNVAESPAVGERSPIGVDAVLEQTVAQNIPHSHFSSKKLELPTEISAGAGAKAGRSEARAA